MPKSMLDKGEKEAKARNKTVDDLIKETFFKDLKPKYFDRKPDIRENVASDGKTATVEVEDNSSRGTVHLVKEDDGWKIKEEDWY